MKSRTGTSLGFALVAFLGGASAAQIRERLSLHGVVSKPGAAHALVQQEGPVAGFDKPWAIDDQRCVTGYWRVGCKEDQQVEQRRTYSELVPKEDQEPMSVEVCWDFCKNVTGAQFFGLSRGSDCYCTPAFDSFFGGNDDTTACTMPCEGNPEQMCGGEKLVDIYEMHDCNNLPAVPCKTAPLPVKNAKLFESRYYRGVKQPCSNAVSGPLDTKGNFRCTVECEEGYYIHENTLKCDERGNRLVYSWSQLVGQASCIPVSCGTPTALLHATYPRTEIKYPNTMTYACDVGYSLNGTAQGRKQQDVQCLASGAYAEVDTCEPVQCGPCPEGPKYPNVAFREDGMRVYKDMCTFDCEKGYTLDQRADGRTMFAIACQYTGEFEEPKTCLPVRCGAAPDIENAQLEEENKDFVYKESAQYKCDRGYSLTGVFGGSRSFEMDCLDDATFETHSHECKPVSNGNPPYVKNAIYQDRVYYYGEGVTYTCKTGYTLDGSATGRGQKMILAGPEGQWQERAPECLPVRCGAPPAVDSAAIKGVAPEALTFDSEPIEYVCNDGYSLNALDSPFAPMHNSFSTSCQADGSIPVQRCVNINDCAVRTCGAEGSCQDLPNPTSDPFDNYRCQCISGYEELERDSQLHVGQKEKFCSDINDCPVPEACGGESWRKELRGVCSDALNTYMCECRPGYTVEQDPRAPSGNVTCLPKSLLFDVKVDNSKYEPDHSGQTVDYDTRPWTVVCDVGYSLDSQPTGNLQASYNMSVTVDGTLTPSKPCLPVSCGAPRTVGFADASPRLAVMTFTQKVTYNCDTGYAVNGDAQGDKTYHMSCMSDGRISDPYVSGEPPVPASTSPYVKCDPVKCGKVPVQEHAAYDKEKEFVYTESVTVHCDVGYSIDQSPAQDKDMYRLHCLAAGHFEQEHETCKPIKCGVPAEIQHTSREPAAELTYGQKVTYTISPGHEVEIAGRIVNTTFDCYCDADGTFNESCAEQPRPTAINCGPAPTVEFATVTGSTVYGGVLTATAFEGFTIDGSATGAKSFTFYCQADGRFSKRETFMPVECGLCPDVSNVDELTLDPVDHSGSFLEIDQGSVGGRRAGLKIRGVSSVTVKRGKKRSGRRLYEAVYQDEVTYKCEEGFVAVDGSAAALSTPVLPTSPTEFTLECASTGDYKNLAGPTSVSCVPVTCEVTNPADMNSAAPVPFASRLGADGKALVAYKQKVQYMCTSRFSLDGTPSGAFMFEEECLASGQMSAEHTCKDKDFCINNKCGRHGSCVDGDSGYSCICEEGYRIQRDMDLLESCVEINECVTMLGDGFCEPGGGKCINELGKYRCECEAGYENKQFDNAGSGMLDSCAPKVCPALPVKDNALSPMQGRVLKYPQSTEYVCAEGYSTTAKLGGAVKISVSCGTDGQLVGLEPTCQKMMCDPANAQALRNGKIIESNGEMVKQQCNEGHFIHGSETEVVLSCELGEWMELKDSCEPISCGRPLGIQGAVGDRTSSMVFGDVVKYTCARGYTVDGTSTGATSFSAVCAANGALEHQGDTSDSGRLPSCIPVTCGQFRGVAHAAAPLTEHRFSQSLSVTCDPGFTVDADPDGESTFVVSCGADGQYKDLKECQPVSCGAPQTTADATSSDGPKVYKEVGTWQCKTGFSTDGSKTGARSYQKLCDARGSFAESSPDGCVDIDYCAYSPCGANGICTDHRGEDSPGYSCQCHEGFELHTNADGKPTCKADDCHGDPCGDHGTCTDLSKAGGPDGSYSCACAPGWAVVEKPNDEGQTCERACCGTLPSRVANTVPVGEYSTPYDVTTYLRQPAEIDRFTGSPLVCSYDVATYECMDGYSTDGRYTPESKTFSITCEAWGEFERAIRSSQECLPVRCDDTFIPWVNNAYVRNRDDNGFTFGQKAEFKCIDGYSTTGLPGGADTFEVGCTAEGVFEDIQTQCYPATCQVPQVQKGYPSTMRLKLGEKVVYTCYPGHFGVGMRAETPDMSVSTFQGVCMADGTISMDYRGCMPAMCPRNIQRQPNTVAGGQNTQLMYGVNKAEFECKDGMTVGGQPGGFLSYQILCQMDGTFSGFITVGGAQLPGGPPNGILCAPVLRDVQGMVTDKDNSRVFISGAKVTIRKGDEVLKTLYTDASGGYSTKLPHGTVQFTVEKEGYETSTSAPIQVKGPIFPGQGADAALTRIVPDLPLTLTLRYHKSRWQTWGELPFKVTLGGEGCRHSISIDKDSRTANSPPLGVSMTMGPFDPSGPAIAVTIRGGTKCKDPMCCRLMTEVEIPQWWALGGSLDMPLQIEDNAPFSIAMSGETNPMGSTWTWAWAGLVDLDWSQR